MSHSVVEITPKVTLRRKLLGEIHFCQLTSISACDSTKQEHLLDIQNDDETHVIFCNIQTDGQIFVSNAARDGLKPMQSMQLRAFGGPRHGVWVSCLFMPDTPCAREFSKNSKSISLLATSQSLVWANDEFPLNQASQTQIALKPHRTNEVTRGPHYDVDATMSIPEPC